MLLIITSTIAHPKRRNCARSAFASPAPGKTQIASHRRRCPLTFGSRRQRRHVAGASVGAASKAPSRYEWIVNKSICVEFFHEIINKDCACINQLVGQCLFSLLIVRLPLHITHVPIPRASLIYLLGALCRLSGTTFSEVALSR